MSSKYSKIEKILPATVSSGANKFEKKKSNSGDSSIPLSGGLVIYIYIYNNFRTYQLND